VLTSSDVRIDGGRVMQRLQELACVGRDPRGGLSRFAFTPEHAEACHLVAGWMAEAGLQPFLDPAGNLVGISDRAAALPAIGVGSHLDTVPMAGSFDGALGVVGAVECAQSLRDADRALTRPFAALAFAEEEGNTFGIGCLTSRVLVGELPPDRMACILDRQGRSLAQRIREWACPLPRREAPAIAAYLELHIEQGPRLEADGHQVAAVSAIAGIYRATVTFRGEANHAGTTPMALRRDALWGAAKLILKVRRAALRTGGEAVATVGQIEVTPGSTNVIPGLTRMRVEVRSGAADCLEEIRKTVEVEAERVAAEFGLTAEASPWDRMPPVPLDEGIRSLVMAAAQCRGLGAIEMPSWAGHDAKILAPHVPTGMVFVPSLRGFSHSPHEHTDPKHVAAGVQVLLDTLLAVDRRLAVA